jgi:hypothetical protein
MGCRSRRVARGIPTGDGKFIPRLLRSQRAALAIFTPVLLRIDRLFHAAVMVGLAGNTPDPRKKRKETKNGTGEK